MRSMRRFNQQMTQEECAAILKEGASGVLAVAGDEGYPYAVPLSYVYEDGKLYFHSAVTGHKVDAVRRDARASFCVIAEDRVVPAEFTTYYRSVIAFGRARVLTDDAEKRRAISVLAAKYAPDLAVERMDAIEKAFPRFCMIELSIEHMTGKEAVELTRAKARP